MNYTYGDPILTVKNLSLQFGKKLILRDINIELKDIIRPETTTGQVITLLGLSGIGKTQLMKMLAGLQEPTTGEIYIGAKQIRPEAGTIGMVLQTYPLFEHRTVKANLLLVCKDKERIGFLADNFDVREHLEKYPCQLSGGQRQRVAIIQQILTSEHFILLDEPFSGLDPKATQKLCLAIRKLADLEEENTIIVSSHILQPSLAVSDTAIMLGNEYKTVQTSTDGIVSSQQEKIPGATIINHYDLAALDLAWHPQIKRDPRFIALCDSIEQEFYK